MDIKEETGLRLKEHIGDGESPDGKKFEMLVGVGVPDPILEVDGRYFTVSYKSIITEMFEFYKKHPKKKEGKK